MNIYRYLLLSVIGIISLKNMNARNIEIQLIDEFLQVEHLNEKAFFERLSDNKFARTEIVNPGKNTYSRFYVNDEREYLLEFYFGGGILVKQKGDIEKLDRVTFTQMQTWLFGDEITYSLDLTKDEYLSLSRDAEEFAFEDEYGESRIESSFKLSNGCLLIHWDDSPGAFMGYGLYEGVKTLYAKDPETVNSISDQIELKKDTGSYLPIYKNDWIIFELEVINGQHINADVARAKLSQIYNIDLEKLNYSKESLDLLDRSIFANWNRVYSDDVFWPFVSYIGEIINREHGLEWIKAPDEKDWPYFLLKKNGERINLDWIIYRRMFDCGLILDSSGAHYGVELELK